MQGRPIMTDQFSFTRVRHGVGRMRLAAALLLAPMLVVPSVAEPLVTISCDKPQDYSMRYGVSPWEIFIKRWTPESLFQIGIFISKSRLKA